MMETPLLFNCRRRGPYRGISACFDVGCNILPSNDFARYLARPGTEDGGKEVLPRRQARLTAPRLSIGAHHLIVFLCIFVALVRSSVCVRVADGRRRRRPWLSSIRNKLHTAAMLGVCVHCGTSRGLRCLFCGVQV